MNDSKITIARTCLEAADSGKMTFPEIVGTLVKAGFESYAIDFRRAVATYYLADGESTELSMQRADGEVAPGFDTPRIQAAIKEAQQLVPSYTYKGFCSKVMAAGCAGYIVSFSGRRALYIGRTAETHVEYFPR